jgi:hypothetical protein
LPGAKDVHSGDVVRIRNKPPTPNVSPPSSTTKATAASKPVVTSSEPVMPQSQLPVGPTSSTQHAPQPGRLAAVDLRNWQPRALRETFSRDLDVCFRMLRTLPPAITFFGGARIQPSDPYWAVSEQIGALLAQHGTPVRTGAGPGIMTSVPEGFKGAQKNAHSDAPHPLAVHGDDVTPSAKSDLRTQGFRIALPFEQDWSAAIDVGAEAALFPYRKLALYENAQGLVTFPGGYGTLDELFEVWSLAMHGGHNKPIAAVGVGFWNPILDVIRQVTDERALIPVASWDRVHVTDSPADLLAHLNAHDDVQVFSGDPIARGKRLGAEMRETLAALDALPTAVTFIGGKRLGDDDNTAGIARDIAASLTTAHVPVRVGGLGAVANAVSAGVASVDAQATVQAFLLDDGADGAQTSARHTQNVRVHQRVRELVTHKECIGRRSQALVALPGGLSTLGELFSVLTLIQCGHLDKMPVVLVGKSYWQPIFDALKTQMLSGERQTIAAKDLDLVTITDDPNVVLRALQAKSSSAGMTTSATPAAGTSEAFTPLPVSTAGLVNESDEARVQRLPLATQQLLASRQVAARDVAFVVAQVGRDDVDGAARVQRLLDAGAGESTFALVRALAPYAGAQTPDAVALKLLRRFSSHAESVAHTLADVVNSPRLLNPDAIDVWCKRLATPGPLADAALAALLEVHARLRAGHALRLDDGAPLVDDTAHTALAHVRLLSSWLLPAVQKAAAQLTDVPSGYTRRVEIDARSNPALSKLDDATLLARVRSLGLPVAVHLELDGGRVLDVPVSTSTAHART